jgi:O-antigen ligase
VNGSSDFGYPQTRRSQALSVSKGDLRVRSSWLNWPLVAILLAGVVIVIADGLTRPLVLEEDWENTEALTYEPYHAAFVFGFAMLPLMMAYRKSAEISRKEGVLLWLVMCTAAYTKDFAYMGVPGAPIFVTDVVLGGLGLALLGSLGSGLKALGRTPRLALTWLFVSGVICAGRGFLSGQDKILVLRDSALVVYSMFLLVSFLVVSSWESVKRIFIFFALGTMFSSINALAWLTAQPGQRRYLPYGVYVLAGLVGAFVLTTSRSIRPALGWSLSGLLAAGVLLANARTIYVALAPILLIMVLIGQTANLQVSKRTLRLVAGMALVFFLLLGAVMQTKAGAELLDTTATELVSGTLYYSDDPKAGFRFLAWLEAGHRFAQNPLLGEGFGVPFIFELASEDVRPHNTFLTILYKMGLLGFLPAMVLFVSFQWKGWRSLRSFHQEREAVFLYVLLLAQLAISVFGSLNLLLESPFLASMFWVILGVGLRVMSLLPPSPHTTARPARVAMGQRRHL